MQNGDEAFPSISPAGIHVGQLVLNAHNSLTRWYTLIRFCILIHFDIITGMQNGDEASPSISLAGFYHLVKMLMWKTDIFVIKISTCFKRSYCLLCHILVQLQIIVKVKVIFILN